MKVYVLLTTDCSDDENQAISVYDNLDNAKTVAHAWLAEQLDESEPPPILEWGDLPDVSYLQNSDEYDERVFIFVREVIQKLPD